MAWKRITTRILGNSTNRAGSLSRGMLFIWCMLASTICYMVPQNSSNKFQLAFAHVFRIPLSAGRNVSLAVGTKQDTKDTVSREMYKELQNRYANLEQRLIKQIQENQHLSDLNTYVGKNVGYILGEATTVDSKHNNLTMSCNRGMKGLAKGQFVLARDNSIIGRVIDILPQTSNATVQLFTNSNCKVAVQIDGIEKDWYMQGNGDGTAKISMVSREQEIKTGQNVFVTTRNGFLDSNMIVGTISNFKPDEKNPLLWDITVKPKWELEKLFEIAVIIRQQ